MLNIEYNGNLILLRAGTKWVFGIGDINCRVSIRAGGSINVTTVSRLGDHLHLLATPYSPIDSRIRFTRSI